MSKQATILSKANIEETITRYNNELAHIPLKIEESNLLDLLKRLKRDQIRKGPYPDVSIFEAANRIMTDLIILNGVKKLLLEPVDSLPIFEEFSVDLGHYTTQKHDIIGRYESNYLAGEAFNVAPSFFNVKKYNSIKKLLKSEPVPSHLIILCNADSHVIEIQGNYLVDNILIIPIEIKL